MDLRLDLSGARREPHRLGCAGEVDDQVRAQPGRDEPPGEVAGVAVWFVSFSTWTGTHGIWLEDLFVRPARRGLGLGQELLRALAGVCVERGYSRLEWWVLDWNAPSIAFYESIGAVVQDGWTRYRLDGPALHTVAAKPAD